MGIQRKRDDGYFPQSKGIHSDLHGHVNKLDKGKDLFPWPRRRVEQ